MLTATVMEAFEEQGASTYTGLLEGIYKESTATINLHNKRAKFS